MIKILVLLSLLDGLLTFIGYKLGLLIEANPVLLTLHTSPILFIFQKITLTICSAILFYFSRDSILKTTVLKLSIFIYLMVVIVQIILLGVFLCH